MEESKRKRTELRKNLIKAADVLENSLKERRQGNQEEVASVEGYSTTAGSPTAPKSCLLMAHGLHLGHSSPKQFSTKEEFSLPSNDVGYQFNLLSSSPQSYRPAKIMEPSMSN
ncbi:unnamed protein product [Spodoptera exigua]|nr:unnamed protein product [Spodoptera exigua]